MITKAQVIQLVEYVLVISDPHPFHFIPRLTVNWLMQTPPLSGASQIDSPFFNTSENSDSTNLIDIDLNTLVLADFEYQLDFVLRQLSPT